MPKSEAVTTALCTVSYTLGASTGAVVPGSTAAAPPAPGLDGLAEAAINTIAAVAAGVRVMYGVVVGVGLHGY